jgi:hypothetical protein
MLNKNVTTGIDGISAREYRQNLYGNITLRQEEAAIRNTGFKQMLKEYEIPYP